MIRLIIKYTVMFAVLVAAQVLVFNQVQFSGFVNPYVYVLFVLLLPQSSPRYVLLVLSFLLGLTIDIFSNSLGVHAAATVFLGYVRPLVIRIISNREEDRSDYPGLAQNKFRWFLYYVSIMVFMHHAILFYLEVFTFDQFFSTLYRVFLSSLFSIAVIVLSQFLIFRE